MVDGPDAGDEFADIAAAFRASADDASGDIGWVRTTDQPRVAGAALAEHAARDIPVDPDGPLYGHLAQGLALGALSAVGAGAPWNSLTDVGLPAYMMRIELEQTWGVHDSEDWFASMASMIGGQEFVEAEAMLDARSAAVARGDYRPDDHDDLWRQWLIDHDYDAEVYEGTRERLAQVNVVDDRLRDCGLLAPGARVTTIAGYVIAWSVRLARGGVVAGYAPPGEAVHMIMAARDSAARIFGSWTEFAVSCVAGTLLHHNIGWDELRGSVATLLSVDHSPWRALPFPLSDLPAVRPDEP
ncbi:DUF1266 domain-containing protein [Gordonia sp. (in: high G+C Gram-positive bacteria)]|uniref:DUF1266 domain-containing protein n=1 Tax=Gordonia sp. (in: high G+C Gram-positive bacteria) TaxID=84139 RepID=UPI0039E72072